MGSPRAALVATSEAAVVAAATTMGCATLVTPLGSSVDAPMMAETVVATAAGLRPTTLCKQYAAAVAWSQTVRSGSTRGAGGGGAVAGAVWSVTDSSALPPAAAVRALRRAAPPLLLLMLLPPPPPTKMEAAAAFSSPAAEAAPPPTTTEAAAAF